MDISLYKPNPSIIEIFDVDETQEDSELCFDLFRKIVTARKTEEVLFLAMGKMLKIFRDRKLYTQLDFENMQDFLASEEISFSREKAYMLIRIYEYYSEYLQLGEDSIKDFPIGRLSLAMPILKKLETREEQIEELQRIKMLRYTDFVRQAKNSLDTQGRPTVYFSKETEKWVVNYFDDRTLLISLGGFKNEEQN